MNTATRHFVTPLAEGEKWIPISLYGQWEKNRIMADLHQVSDGREALEFLRWLGTRFPGASHPDSTGAREVSPIVRTRHVDGRHALILSALTNR